MNKGPSKFIARNVSSEYYKASKEESVFVLSRNNTGGDLLIALFEFKGKTLAKWVSQSKTAVDYWTPFSPEPILQVVILDRAHLDRPFSPRGFNVLCVLGTPRLCILTGIQIEKGLKMREGG